MDENVVSDHSKNTSRANKTCSRKFVFPKSYSNNKEYKNLVETIFEYITKNKISIESCIISLANNIFNKLPQNLNLTSKILKYNAEYFNHEQVKYILDLDIPVNFGFDDFLGVFYQAVTNEGKRNSLGMYYTPKSIVDDVLSDMEIIDNNSKFLDPCCGSGQFLINIPCSTPYNLIGFDIDPIAVMIAKANLIIKYHSYDFYPNIYECNFLNQENVLIYKNILNNVRYIITNPPWGAKCDETSRDTFIEFLYKSLLTITNFGLVKFLCPSSFLNIKCYKESRRKILSQYNVQKITKYQRSFTGVVTDFISISIDRNNTKNQNVEIINKQTNENMSVNILDLLQDNDCIIPTEMGVDENIFNKVFNIPDVKYQTLKDSMFCLGIVTGNNKEKILDNRSSNQVCEKIYTGKNIQKYRLEPSTKYIDYDRNTLQQVALDKYYRIDEKLVYKFISKSLVFSYDNKKSLFLNSANILIPKIDGMSIKTVLAFLNSDLYNYIYMKRFKDVKVIKHNLLQLKFPTIPKDLNDKIIKYVDLIINGGNKYSEDINLLIYDYFKLSQDDIAKIQVYINKQKSII